MKQLIKITEQNGNRAVSARELYDFLEVETKFPDWIKRMFEYGFDENIDFLLLNFEKQNGSGGHNKTDYALTIDTAKEIAMLQRTAKGKEARQYFIAMEKVAIDKILQGKNLQKINESGVSQKRLELLDMIRFYLKWGDMARLTESLGYSTSYVRQVANNLAYNTKDSEKVFNALYNKALENKNELLFDYQQMIDELKK